MPHQEIHSEESPRSREMPGRQRNNSEFAVDARRRLVTVKFGRKLSMREIERYASQLRLNPAFSPAFGEIVDLTSVDELDLQAEEFLALADKVDPFASEAKRAFVAKTTVQKHAARMHKILRTSRNIEIFESVEAAEKWIAG